MGDAYRARLEFYGSRERFAVTKKREGEIMRSMRFLLPFLLLLTPSLVSAESTGWSIDKPVAHIPDRPLSGQLFGNDFKLESATINDHAISLRSAKTSGGRGYGSDIIIFVGTDELEDDLVITPKSDGMLPHIHMHFPKSEKAFMGTLMYMEQYSMRLSVVRKNASAIKMRIHLSLPDYKKSFLVGTFTAKVE